jgi:hypothetical protein
MGKPWGKMKKRIAIDFDGVIHDYTHGWQDGAIHGGPVLGAIEAMERLLEEGFDILILTTRGSEAVQVELIRQWLRDYEFSAWDTIEITNEKHYALAYIDDRAVRFTNWLDVRKYFS